MTARDEAIEIAIDGFLQWTDDNNIDPIGDVAVIAAAITTGVDAIPGDVLVRLAKERGALEEAGVYESEIGDRSGVYYDDEALPSDAKPLYRLVGS